MWALEYSILQLFHRQTIILSSISSGTHCRQCSDAPSQALTGLTTPHSTANAFLIHSYAPLHIFRVRRTGAHFLLPLVPYPSRHVTTTLKITRPPQQPRHLLPKWKMDLLLLLHPQLRQRKTRLAPLEIQQTTQQESQNPPRTRPVPVRPPPVVPSVRVHCDLWPSQKFTHRVYFPSRPSLNRRASKSPPPPPPPPRKTPP
jgi:hypothetical protein